MGARYINNDGTPVKKVVGAKKQYENINGVFEPVFYDGYILYNELTSDGNAYIDLGHKGDSTHRYELYLEINKPSGEAGCFGTRIGNAATKGHYLTLNSSTIYSGISDGASNIWKNVQAQASNKIKVSYTASKIEVTINGTTTSGTGNVANFITDGNLFAFALNISGTSTLMKSNAKYHSIKEYDANGVLLYH